VVFVGEASIVTFLLISPCVDLLLAAPVAVKKCITPSYLADPVIAIVFFVRCS
jgi:hypothetical protein